MSFWNTFNNVKNSFDKSNIILNKNIISNSNDQEKDKCIKCGLFNIIYEDGKSICTQCGIDNGPIIDFSQEWRFYGSDDNKKGGDPNRCGAPSNDLFNNESFGIVMQGYGYEKYRNALKWHSIQYKEKSLMDVYNYIQEICDEANIPYCVADKAKSMYKMIKDDLIKRGDQRLSLIAACIFYACKYKGVSRKRKEIADLFNFDNTKMTIGCNQFKEIMYSINKDFINGLKPTSTEDFIRRNCILLGINNIYRDICIYVANISDIFGINKENIPSSISVGIIFFVSNIYNLNISKKKIASVCDTSEVTVSKTFKNLKEFKKYILPPDITPSLLKSI